MPLDPSRLRHALRAALTCLAAVALQRWLQLPMWLPISAAAVMCTEPRMGGLLQRSYTRLAGTLLGAALALSAQVVLGPGPTATMVVSCLSVGGFAYLATGSANQAQIGTLGALTSLIVLVEPSSSLETAGLRIFSVVLGVLLAVVCSRFLLPDQAEPRLRATIRRALADLASHYRSLQDDPDIGGTALRAVVAQQKLISEAALESSRFDAPRYAAILRSERRLFRYLQVLIASSRELPVQPSLEPFHKGVSAALDELAAGRDTAVAPLSELLEAWSPPTEAAAQAFRYTAGLFVDELANLSERLQTAARAGR